MKDYPIEFIVRKTVAKAARDSKRSAKDIAEEACLSVGTVRRLMYDEGRCMDTTIELVCYALDIKLNVIPAKVEILRVVGGRGRR